MARRQSGIWRRCCWLPRIVSRRLQRTRYAHVAKLALSLVGLVMRIRRSPHRPEDKDLDLLPKSSLAIKRAFSPEEKAEVAIKISEEADRLASRR